MKLSFLVSSLLLPLSMPSCQHSLPSYLVTQGLKQGSLYIRAKPIYEILRDPLWDPKTKEFLQLSQEVLHYASNELGMKTGRTYSHFVQLPEPWVTHVVVAAKRDRLEAHLFQYPIFGGLPYRGYFKKQEALEFSETLKEQNLDVYVRAVSAYSTTGWLPDPVLSSMISNELQFIELLFHELVHLQFYIPNQADFNEAFATWFAEKATLQFIENSNRQEKVKEALIQAFHKQLKRNRLKLTNSMEAIEMAKTLYDSEEFKKMSNSQKESARAQLFEKIRQHFAVHEELKRWGEMEWNNALLISLSTYYRLVDSIEAYSIKHKLDAKALLDHVKNNPNSILSEL